MVKAEDLKSEWSIVTAIDVASKAIAVLGAVCVLTGTLYNVSFFLATRPDWLFHLTVADNLTATFYALPFVLMIAAVNAVIILGPIWLGKFEPHGRLGTLFVYLTHGLITLAFIVGIWAAAGPAMVLPFMLACVVVVIVRHNLAEAPIPTRIGGFTALALSFLTLCTVVVAVNSIWARSEHEAYVEVGDRAGSSTLNGQLIRVLDSGLILRRKADSKQKPEWIWIPKERVLQIRESAPD